MAAFLNRLTDEEIQAMADTYTEGYRIGFEVTGKDLGKKQTVQLRLPIGFERMVRAAVHNFEKEFKTDYAAFCNIIQTSSLTMSQ